MTPIFSMPALSYREAHFLETMLTDYIRSWTHYFEDNDEPVACVDCSAYLAEGEPHGDGCEVQIAHDILNRLHGHPLPHEEVG